MLLDVVERTWKNGYYGVEALFLFLTTSHSLCILDVQ